MAVLADAYEGYVDRGALQLAPDLDGRSLGVMLGIDQVMTRDPCRTDQAVEQVAAEAGGVIDRQPDVFVEMEQFHPGPIDAG